MPRIDLVVQTPISRSSRARQLEGMFDVPPSESSRLEWHIDAPIDEQPWSVGLIVGPSGSGKTTVAREIFGAEALTREPSWGASSVIDDFDKSHSIQEIADICQAVGFNTIPAWMRPHAVLSDGEKFRVTLARRMLEEDSIVFDEFTSVVDRQVAKIGSHAVQKFVRRHGKKFVAVSCHYDIEEWLQPDWVIEPATGTFRRRSLQRRPSIDVAISPVPYAAWSLFAPYHYLTADLHRAARCWGLFADGRLAAFAGMLHRPISRKGKDERPIWGVSRVVTLPDFQGLGLAFALLDAVGAVYRAIGARVRNYPAHPAFVRAHDRSPRWALMKEPGKHSAKGGASGVGWAGGRPNAVFEYAGPAHPDVAEAKRIFAYWNTLKGEPSGVADAAP